MRKKLERKEYPNAAAFYGDFRLLIKNCETIKPVGTLVRSAGDQLNKVFEEKWSALPPLRPVSESEESDSDDGDDACKHTITCLNIDPRQLT
jgi:hypothetical protein